MGVFKNLAKSVCNVVVATSNVAVDQSKRIAHEVSERSGKLAVMAEEKSAALLAKSEEMKASSVKPVVVKDVPEDVKDI